MISSEETSRQQIDALKARFVGEYPLIWQRMAAEWNAGGEDRAWLMYSANYLFRTGGVLWAVDPFCLQSRFPTVPAVDLAGGLRNLSFVLLTHRHADHLDLPLIRALRCLPVTWVIPDFLADLVIEQTGLPRSRIIVPRVQEPFDIQGVRMTPFEGLHFEYAKSLPIRGVPAMGYLVEHGGRRWLFPGDTRTYDLTRLPSFGPVDILFAHLWLGRGGALTEPPPLLDDFCRFCLALQPRRLVLTHLHEIGREPEEYWDQRHVGQVSDRLAALSRTLSVQSLLLGQSLRL